MDSNAGGQLSSFHAGGGATRLAGLSNPGFNVIAVGDALWREEGWFDLQVLFELPVSEAATESPSGKWRFGGGGADTSVRYSFHWISSSLPIWRASSDGTGTG